MFNLLKSFIAFSKSWLPFTYSILLIILVPLTLVANTWWNLKAFDRDMNVAVREQALTISRTLILLIQSEQPTPDYEQLLKQIRSQFSGLEKASILIPDETGTMKVVSTTHPSSIQQDEHIPFNQLAWSQNESYFTKVINPENGQELWMMIAPFNDALNNKVGLMNLKVGTDRIEAVLHRTTRDSLLILGLSVFLVILLLINHLRFFERSLLVEKLKQVDQMKDDFISVASHELRAPLTAIKSAISMITEDYKDKIPPEIQQWLDISNQAVVRLGDLVNDLLNVSRIEQNRLDFDLATVDVTALIQEIVDQQQFMAKEKNLTLIFDHSSPSIQALANVDRLREVIINLVNNAIKYTIKGSVTISHKVEESKVKVIVQDTGIGIAPEDKARLFQKFSRITSDQTREIPGTGLGLWITKAMVEKMKGQIFVDSIMNQGTAFTVVLKAVDQK